MQRHEDVVLNQIGTPIPGVTITVRVQNATPGSGALATIYSDDGSTVISGSAVTTDTFGRFFFFAPDGKYDLVVTGTGITTYILADTEIADVTERFSSDSGWATDTQTVGKWNDVRIVDGIKFATIQAAIDDLSSTGGTVYVPIGTYTLAAELAMHPNVRVIGAGVKSIITQGSAANLTNMVNFSTNSADDGSLESLTIDGNRDNNTSGNSLVNMSTRSDNKVSNCTVKNAIASGIIAQAVTNCDIFHNKFDAIHDTAIQFQPTSATSTASRISNNYGTRWGAGFIKITKAADNEVQLNQGDGTQINSVVDTTTSVVTWVSGDTFSTLLSGMFANVNGTETQITSVDSSTQITVVADLGSQSSAAMIAGSGDGITLNTARSTGVIGNRVSKSMANGFVVTNSVGTLSAAKNRLIGNHAEQCGDAGIWLVDNDGGGLTIDSTLLASNLLAENGIAGHTNFDVGIKLSGTSVNNTAIHGNIFRDFQGTPTQTTAIGMDTATSTGNIVGINYTFGAMAPLRSPLNADSDGFSGPLAVHGGLVANEEGSDLDSQIKGNTDVNLFYVDAGNDRVGIGTSTPSELFDVDGTQKAIRYKAAGTSLVAGDFALSGGWGTTASVSSILGTDQRFRMTITSAGTGQGANPTATLTFKDGTWTLAPFAVANRGGGSQATIPITVASISATTLVLTFQGTPIAAQTYTINCLVIG